MGSSLLRSNNNLATGLWRSAEETVVTSINGRVERNETAAAAAPTTTTRRATARARAHGRGGVNTWENDPFDCGNSSSVLDGRHNWCTAVVHTCGVRAWSRRRRRRPLRGEVEWVDRERKPQQLSKEDPCERRHTHILT